MINRKFTIKTRTDIGFKSKSIWSDAHAEYDAHTLTILGHPVMEDWETSYMKVLADIATHNGGYVLELGFGMGISSAFIHQRKIKEHIIIEANKEVAEKARLFAQKASHKTRVIEGFWEDVIEQIESGSIDGILFDTYPLSELEIHKNHYSFFPHAHRVLKTGGILTYYSDEVRDFGKEHKQKLLKAGFTNHTNIQKIVVRVAPPENCKYWKDSTIIAPIVVK